MMGGWVGMMGRECIGGGFIAGGWGEGGDIYISGGPTVGGKSHRIKLAFVNRVL